MARPSRFSPEVRERAVRMVFEHAQDHASQWAAITSIAEKIGCAAETLRSWVRQAERDGGRRPGLTTDERARSKQLECENVELPRANEILRLASGVFREDGPRQPSQVMVGFIDDDRETFGVEALCRSRVAGESRGLRSSESLEAAQARRAGRGPRYGGVPD